MKITFQRTAALIVFNVVMPGPINSKINAGITPNRFLITEICKIGKISPNVRTITLIRSNAARPINKIAIALVKAGLVKIPTFQTTINLFT